MNKIIATMRNGNSTYNFDQIGNRSSAAVPAAVSSPGGNFDYTTNALNQYTAIENGAPVNPIHDLDGNLVDDGKGTTFEWNGENRMVRVHKGDLTIENTYDGQGRRVRKLVIDDGTPIEDHRYFYDGWNLIFEYDEINALENTRYYVWGLDLSQSLQGAGGVGGLLIVRQGQDLWAPTYDANGNISEYIDLSDGSVTAHLEYDAFGRKIVSTGTAPSNFGFSTKYEDVETGYLYYGFRYYDPETGRWPNRDPIEEEGGENLYGFIYNNPVLEIDVYGLSSLSDCLDNCPSRRRGQRCRRNCRREHGEQRGRLSLPNLSQYIVAGGSGTITACAPIPILGPAAAACFDVSVSFEGGTCCQNGELKNYLSGSITFRGYIRGGAWKPVSGRIRQTIARNLQSCPENYRSITGGFFVRFTGGFVWGSCSWSYQGGWQGCEFGITSPVTAPSMDIGGSVTYKETIVN
ncbi:MAG: RHS repeat-associated core domain-containing protein [Kiritimatiellae bacterium]|nr:RHS repeat-associated core domain-containing protein [Kiritimatiellia bacterium]